MSESQIVANDRAEMAAARNAQDRGETRKVSGIRHDDRELPSWDEVQP